MRRIVAVVPLALGVALGACASTPPNAESNQSRVRVEATDPRAGSMYDIDVQQHAQGTEEQLPLTAVAAFDALPDAYRRLGIATVALVDTSGSVYTVGVRNLRVHGSLGGKQLSTYIDCGSAPMHDPANSYDVILNATSYVTPSGQGSTVHTLVTANARDPMANTPPVECASTGRFERSVADLLTHPQPQG